jgi:GTP cyclohydrolase II/3,4-dihydroxy 2-butanone 4-phosphate synthase/GTP cyclohydrolase II
MPADKIALKAVTLDIDWSAQTLLPIEFGGREVTLEARAYQGEDPANGASAAQGGQVLQGMALIHRGTGANADAMASVRVHSGCVTGDIFHSLRCDCYAQLQEALARILDVPNGVLIYLPYHEGRGIGLFKKIQTYALQDQGLDTVDANLHIGAPIDARDYSMAACILDDLGFKRIRLMTNNPEKVTALEAAGIEVAERIPLVIEPGPHNERYLETKRRRMRHDI